jgi:hypothetical protein
MLAEGFCALPPETRAAEGSRSQPVAPQPLAVSDTELERGWNSGEGEMREDVDVYSHNKSSFVLKLSAGRKDFGETFDGKQ